VLSRELAQLKANLILVDRDEEGVTQLRAQLASAGYSVISYAADLSDAKTVDQIISSERPEIVFHLAAFKYADLAEQSDFREEARRSNEVASKNMIGAAQKAGVQTFVAMSSDKAADPMNYYGRTKRDLEKYVRQAASGSFKVIAVRAQNILGSTGSVIPVFEAALEKNRSLSVSPDSARFFLTAAEFVSILLNSVPEVESGDVVLVKPKGEAVYISDLAERLRTLRRKPEVVIRHSRVPGAGEKKVEIIWTPQEKAHLVDGGSYVRLPSSAFDPNSDTLISPSEPAGARLAWKAWISGLNRARLAFADWVEGPGRRFGWAGSAVALEYALFLQWPAVIAYPPVAFEGLLYIAGILLTGAFRSSRTAQVAVLTGILAGAFYLFHFEPSDSLWDAALRMKSMYDVSLWQILATFMSAAAAKMALRKSWRIDWSEWTSSGRWALTAILGGHYIFYDAVPFFNANMTGAWSRAAFDLGVATTFVHMPLFILLGAVLGEDQSTTDRSFFRNFYRSYVGLYPKNFLWWFPTLGAAWMISSHPLFLQAAGAVIAFGWNVILTRDVSSNFADRPSSRGARLAGFSSWNLDWHLHHFAGKLWDGLRPLFSAEELKDAAKFVLPRAVLTGFLISYYIEAFVWPELAYNVGLSALVWWGLFIWSGIRPPSLWNEVIHQKGRPVIDRTYENAAILHRSLVKHAEYFRHPALKEVSVFVRVNGRPVPSNGKTWTLDSHGPNFLQHALLHVKEALENSPSGRTYRLKTGLGGDPDDEKKLKAVFAVDIATGARMALNVASLDGKTIVDDSGEAFRLRVTFTSAHPEDRSFRLDVLQPVVRSVAKWELMAESVEMTGYKSYLRGPFGPDEPQVVAYLNFLDNRGQNHAGVNAPYLLDMTETRRNFRHRGIFEAALEQVGHAAPPRTRIVVYKISHRESYWQLWRADFLWGLGRRLGWGSVDNTVFGKAFARAGFRFEQAWPLGVTGKISGDVFTTYYAASFVKPASGARLGMNDPNKFTSIIKTVQPLVEEWLRRLVDGDILTFTAPQIVRDLHRNQLPDMNIGSIRKNVRIAIIQLRDEGMVELIEAKADGTHVYRVTEAGLKKFGARMAESDSTRGLLSALLAENENYDFQANAARVEALKGRSLGRLSNRGTISLIPSRRFRQEWWLLGSAPVRQGWKAVITDAKVVRGIPELRIRLEHADHDPIPRVFQISPYRVSMKARDGSGDTKKAFTLDEEPGLRGLSRLVALDVYPRAGDEWRLDGQSLGETDAYGNLTFAVKKQNYVWHVGVPNARLVVQESGFVDGVWRMSVAFEQHGTVLPEEVYQLSPYRLNLVLQTVSVMEPKQAFRLEKAPGKRVLSDWVKKPDNQEWAAYLKTVPSGVGLRLNDLDDSGAMVFNPVAKHRLRWIVEPAWAGLPSPVIVRQGIADDQFWFAVRGETAEGLRYRVFSIGPGKTSIPRVDEQTGSYAEILEITPASFSGKFAQLKDGTSGVATAKPPLDRGNIIVYFGMRPGTDQKIFREISIMDIKRFSNISFQRKPLNRRYLSQLSPSLFGGSGARLAASPETPLDIPSQRISRLKELFAQLNTEDSDKYWRALALFGGLVLQLENGDFSILLARLMLRETAAEQEILNALDPDSLEWLDQKVLIRNTAIDYVPAIGNDDIAFEEAMDWLIDTLSQVESIGAKMKIGTPVSKDEHAGARLANRPGDFGYGLTESAIRTIHKMHRRYYGTPIPPETLAVLETAVKTGRADLAAIRRVVASIDDADALKPFMSKALAKVLVWFISLLRRPLTMTMRNRFRPLRWLMTEVFPAEFDVFKPERAQKGKALYIGVGYPTHAIEEFAEFYPGEITAVDRAFAERVLVLSGKSREGERHVTINVVFDASGKIDNKTVESDSEKRILAIQSTLSDSQKAEKLFAGIAAAIRGNTDYSKELEELGNIAELDLKTVTLNEKPYSRLDQREKPIRRVAQDAFSGKLTETFGESSHDVVEMMNVTLYYNEEAKIRFMKDIEKVLVEGGVFIEGKASPGGSEFIYLVYQKKNGKLKLVREYYSAGNLRRPLWAVTDFSANSRIRSQGRIFRLFHQPHREARKHLRKISKKESTGGRSINLFIGR
jgi:nucleoside-diphosphate-sugar epimerase